MILNGNNTNNFNVNYLAEIVLNEIPKTNNTIIEVYDVGNFFLFKGKTDSEEVLDLLDTFEKIDIRGSDKNFFRKISHVVDLIDYGVKPDKSLNNRFILHNSENPIYHQSQIDFFIKNPEISSNFDYQLVQVPNITSCKSQFPFGYSFNQSRNKLMYSKLMINHIPTYYPFSSLIIEFPESETDFENISVFDVQTRSFDENLKSAFLDYFDFNLESLRKDFESLEIAHELKNPTIELDFLKNKVEKLIII